jgi:hypothetical protein
VGHYRKTLPRWRARAFAMSIASLTKYVELEIDSVRF